MSYLNYFKNLITLSTPILFGNIGQMLIGIGDIYVAGHYHTNTLAAISVASAIFMTFIIAGLGLCSAVTPVLSNYIGEKRPVKCLFGVTILFSIVISLIFFVTLMASIPLTYKIGLNAEIVDDCAEYLRISAYSIFGIYIFSIMKEFLQAHEKVILPNILLGVSVILNIILNFIFVYGYKIIPEMGTSGLAYASLVVRTFCAIILFAFCFRFLDKSIFKNTFYYIKDIIKVGTPIAIATMIEFFGFNIVAVIVGRFEPIYAACHNIIIATTSLAYMVPFSLSNALAVKIGNANGARNIKEIKGYIITSGAIILLYALIASLIYILFKYQIMRIFTKDINVIELGASIMMIVACFVTFDGIQAVCIGALKGLKKTLHIMLVIFFSYIFVSIPLGLTLAFKFNIILEGLWIGLAFAIFTSAVISGGILFKSYNKLKKIYK